MFQRGLFIAILVILENVYSLPVEEKIEPVELFHICIDPKDDDIKPRKNPVILLHGLLGTHKSFDGINQHIADQTNRRVCSVDLRNHGDSPWNNRSDIAAFVADLDYFLKMQNITNVNIIGESLGGKIAMHYTLNNPHEVDSIIIEDMRPNSITNRAIIGIKIVGQLLKRIIETQPNDMDENQAKKYLEQSLKNAAKQMEAYQKLPDDISKYFELQLINGKWQFKHNMDIFYEGINNINEIWTKSTGLYTGPSLFIYGSDSAFKVAEDEDNILKLFPNAKLIPIANTGHILHENNREFEDIAVNFLNEIN